MTEVELFRIEEENVVRKWMKERCSAPNIHWKYDVCPGVKRGVLPLMETHAPTWPDGGRADAEFIVYAAKDNPSEVISLLVGQVRLLMRRNGQLEAAVAGLNARACKNDAPAKKGWLKRVFSAIFLV